MLEEYTLYPDRLMVRRGLFGTVEEELLLYRVLDITLRADACERLTRSGTIILHAVDSTDPVLWMRGVTGADRVRDLLREAVQAARDAAGVTGREMWGATR